MSSSFPTLAGFRVCYAWKAVPSPRAGLWRCREDYAESRDSQHARDGRRSIVVRTRGAVDVGSTASNSNKCGVRSSYRLAMGSTVIPRTHSDRRSRRTRTYESGVRLHREGHQSNSTEQRRCERRDSGCPADVRKGVRVLCIDRGTAGSISPRTPGDIERRCGRSVVFSGRETGLRDPRPSSRISHQPAIGKAPPPGHQCYRQNLQGTCIPILGRHPLPLAVAEIREPSNGTQRPGRRGGAATLCMLRPYRSWAHPSGTGPSSQVH